jgi:hypothetical protein
MPFQLIEVVEDTQQRNVGSMPYETHEEALESAVRSAQTFQGGYGYDNERCHWWGKDADGRLTRILVEGV